MEVWLSDLTILRIATIYIKYSVFIISIHIYLVFFKIIIQIFIPTIEFEPTKFIKKCFTLFKGIIQKRKMVKGQSQNRWLFQNDFDPRYSTNCDHKKLPVQSELDNSYPHHTCVRNPEHLLVRSQLLPVRCDHKH